jgi:hypothetical protein
VRLVRDATGEADRPPPSGRAMSVLDLSGGERSSESGMQHLSLLSSATTLHFVPTQVAADRSFVLVGLCASVLRSELEFACRGF